MNRSKSLITLALSFAAAGGAFAEAVYEHSPPFESSLTRAEVQAELVRYKKAGVNPWANSYNLFTGFQSQRSRDEVRAEYLRARDEVAAMTSEDSGSAYYLDQRFRHADATSVARR